jgi:hypothetical protein
MSSITIELNHQFENESVYRLIVAYSRSVYIKLLTKILLFVLYRLIAIQEIILRKKISKLKELVVLLKGYGVSIKEISYEQRAKDYEIIQKVIPVYQNLNLFLSHRKNKSEIFRELKTVIESLLAVLESIEATLEIYSNEEDVKSIETTLQDLKQGNKQKFVKWKKALK